MSQMLVTVVMGLFAGAPAWVLLIRPWRAHRAELKRRETDPKWLADEALRRIDEQSGAGWRWPPREDQ